MGNDAAAAALQLAAAAAAAAAVASEEIRQNGLVKDVTPQIPLALTGQVPLPLEKVIADVTLGSVSEEAKNGYVQADGSVGRLDGSASTHSEDASTSGGELDEDGDYCCKICGLPKKNHLCWLNDTEDPIVATAESNAESFMIALEPRPKRTRKPITRYQGGDDEEQIMRKSKKMKLSAEETQPARRSSRRSQKRWNVVVEDGF
uniref:Uncharacterized protein n=1 Tax=Grammatophora oceanica TaxID=210454 RepID=A0A7S1YKT4_9STRA